MVLGGCGSDAVSNTVIPTTGETVQAATVITPAPVQTRKYDVWQNPFMSVNPTNNVHSDSYMSDTCPQAGPTAALNVKVAQVGDVTILDPATGTPRFVRLGECAAQAFDAQGNIQTVSGGVETVGATDVERSIVTIDARTLKVLAWTSFLKPVEHTGTVDFGGAGYFYQDNQYRMVVALPDGHVQVLRRIPSTAGGIDGYTADRDINVCGTNGKVPVPTGLASLSLYGVVPDKAGNIWFTTAEGVIGTITPADGVHWINVNDPNNTGVQQGNEKIANSHAMDEGDGTAAPSGMYVATTYKQYRFSAAADGTPHMDWSMAYDRGPAQKSGQVSYGSGTTPTVFRLGARRFVTIADNATNMHVNVYRAEATLQPGEQRLFAQIAPFGDNPLVSDENSLIVAPSADGQSVDIYAENNWGNDGPLSTFGAKVTQPGFARVNLKPDGAIAVASVNSTIAVPSLVSKMSLGSNTVYTYNKTTTGWYLTGLDGDNLNLTRFTALVGPGEMRFNNFYAAMAVDPGGQVCYIGTFLGLTRVDFSP